MNLSIGAITALSTAPVNGTFYRVILPSYLPTALASRHSRRVPSRFNAGRYQAAVRRFETIYMSDNPIVPLFEVNALFGSPSQAVPNPFAAGPWITLIITVNLQRVADLCHTQDLRTLAASAQGLTGDWRGYHQAKPTTPPNRPIGTAPTQRLGAALFRSQHLEGFYTLSAKLTDYRNLVIFPDRLLQGSSIRTVYIDQNGQQKKYDVIGKQRANTGGVKSP